MAVVSMVVVSAGNGHESSKRRRKECVDGRRAGACVSGMGMRVRGYVGPCVREWDGYVGAWVRGYVGTWVRGSVRA